MLFGDILRDLAMLALILFAALSYILVVLRTENRSSFLHPG
jgi:hypothetical protein